jgi:hypothetical protein
MGAREDFDDRDLYTTLVSDILATLERATTASATIAISVCQFEQHEDDDSNGETPSVMSTARR